MLAHVTWLETTEPKAADMKGGKAGTGGGAEPCRTAVVESARDVYSGFFRLEEAVVSHPRFDGSEQTITRLSLERGDSVAVVLVDARRRLVWLTEQFRYSTLKAGPGWLLEIPAGVVEAGEPPEDCARREVAEETGFTVGTLESIATTYVSPGGTSERLTLYFAAVDGATRSAALAEQGRDPDEDIQVVERDLDSFMNDARSGRIDDMKTMLAGLWLLAHRERLGL